MDGAQCAGPALALLGQIHASPVPLTAYKKFVDTYLHGFVESRSMLLVENSETALASEAERWVQEYSVPAAERAHANNSTLAISSASNVTYDANSNTTNAAASSSISGTCLSDLTRLLTAKVDLRPPSFITVPLGNRSNGLVLLSGGDRSQLLGEEVVANHRKFALKHGYTHWFHRGSFVRSRGWLPYWHKIAHIRMAMARFPSAAGYVWVDDDVVLTNHLGEDMITRALRQSNASVLVTRDPAARVSGVQLNTGVMIVRGTSDARNVMSELWRRASERRGDGMSLVKDLQSQHCLHEQQALQEMVLGSSYWRRRIAILEQRDVRNAAAQTAAQTAGLLPSPAAAWNLNTFLRWSHYSSERSEHMRFDNDAWGSRWRPNDFAGHCSGLSPLRRSLCLSLLLNSTI